jgi:Predicted signal transduction protein with a C-terminal ATPase domain
MDDPKSPTIQEHNMGKVLGWTVNIKLRTKLLIAFLVIGIIPIFLTGYYFYMQSYRVVLQNSRQYTMEMLLQVDKNIQSKIQAIDNISLSIVINHSIISLLNETDEVRKGRNRREIEQYLRSILISSNDIHSIIIIDKNGTKYGFEDSIIAPSYDLKKSEYYIEALKGKGNNVWFGRCRSIVININRPISMIFSTSAVINNLYPYGDYVGFLLIEVRENAFYDILSDIYTDKSGNILMLDEHKNLMLTTKPLENAIPDNLFKNIKQTRGSFLFKIRGVDNLVTYLKNERTGWYTVSVIPVEFLVKNANLIKNAIFNISFIIMIICIFFAFSVSNRIAKGFNQLITVMGKVQEGKFDIRINSKRRDEIGKLSQAFDTMIAYINNLIRKNYEQKIREKNAQLEALQAQIAPHFLYNALDSINWMLLDKDEKEISAVVIALGDLLRYSIGNKKEMMPVKDEIKQIENYLLIQKVRFEERFTYDIQIESDLAEMLIPKLLIQPIVENSVVHGVEKLLKDGRIEIRGYETERYVIFEVKDNGVGVTGDKLAVILEDSAAKSSNRTHIGLANVNQRIKLIYGENYGIEISSIPSQGMIVKIKLPAGLSKGV